MGDTSGMRKEIVKGDGSKLRSDYLTTTEFARLCGVSRFTIINWAKRGKIKAIRTAGRHYRIPASEALKRAIRQKNKKQALMRNVEIVYQTTRKISTKKVKRKNCCIALATVLVAVYAF